MQSSHRLPFFVSFNLSAFSPHHPHRRVGGPSFALRSLASLRCRIRSSCREVIGFHDNEYERRGAGGVGLGMYSSSLIRSSACFSRYARQFLHVTRWRLTVKFHVLTYSLQAVTALPVFESTGRNRKCRFGSFPQGIGPNGS